MTSRSDVQHALYQALGAAMMVVALDSKDRADLRRMQETIKGTIRAWRAYENGEES